MAFHTTNSTPQVADILFVPVNIYIPPFLTTITTEIKYKQVRTLLYEQTLNEDLLYWQTGHTAL